MTDKSKWIWMPHTAHLCVGHKCRFHLATCVGNFIVSTVGELWPSRGSREISAKIKAPTWYQKNKHLKGDAFDYAYMKKFGFEKIGSGRKYETYVFPAMKNKDKDSQCCPYRPSDWGEIDSLGYNDPVEATKGHMKLCKKWSKKPKESDKK